MYDFSEPYIPKPFLNEVSLKCLQVSRTLNPKPYVAVASSHSSGALRSGWPPMVGAGSAAGSRVRWPPLREVGEIHGLYMIYIYIYCVCIYIYHIYIYMYDI